MAGTDPVWYMPGVVLRWLLVVALYICVGCNGSDAADGDAADGAVSSLAATINGTTFEAPSVSLERRAPLGHLWITGSDDGVTLTMANVHFDGSATDPGFGFDTTYSALGTGEWSATCYFSTDFAGTSEGWSGSYDCTLEPQGSTPPPAVQAHVIVGVVFAEIPPYP